MLYGVAPMSAGVFGPLGSRLTSARVPLLWRSADCPQILVASGDTFLFALAVFTARTLTAHGPWSVLTTVCLFSSYWHIRGLLYWQHPLHE